MKIAINPKNNSIILPAVIILAVLGISLTFASFFKSGKKIQLEFQNGKLSPQSAKQISDIFAQNLKKATSQKVAPEKTFEKIELDLNNNNKTLTSLFAQNFFSEITKKNPATVLDQNYLQALQNSSDPTALLGINNLNPAFEAKTKGILNSLIYSPPSFKIKNNASRKEKIDYFSALSKFILPFKETNDAIILDAMKSKNYDAMAKRIEELKSSLLGLEKLETPAEYVDLQKKIISFHGYQINVFKEIETMGENNDPMGQYIILQSYGEVLNKNFKTIINEAIKEINKLK